MEGSWRQMTKDKPSSTDDQTEYRVKGLRSKKTKTSPTYEDCCDQSESTLSTTDGRETKMISLPVYYHIGNLRKDTKIHKEMNLTQYMRWMFVMHSSSRLSDIKRDFKMKDEEIELDVKGLHILKYLNNKEHSNRIVERVVEAVETKSQDLSITVCPTDNPETCVHEIMQSGFATSNTIYAETLNSNVVIIFPEDVTPGINEFLEKKLPILKHSKIYSVNYEKYISMDQTLLKLIKNLRILDALAKGFPKLKLKIINNDSASQLYICGSQQEVSSCFNTFEKEYKQKIKNKIVHLKIRKMDVFKETELFQILENCLEVNRCKCVLSLLQSSQQLQLTAYDANEINVAERKLKQMVHEEKVILTGKWKNATEMKRLHSTYKYEGVLLTLDEAGAACFVTGLKANVTKVVNELTTDMEEAGENVIVADRSEFRRDAGSKYSSETVTKHQTPVKLKKPALHIEEIFDQEKGRKTWIFPNRHKLVVWRKNVTQSEADILVRTMEVGNEIKNHNIGAVQHANGEKTTIEGNVFLPVYTRDKPSAERKLKAALTSVLEVAERDNERSVAFPLKEVKSWPIEQIQRALISSCAEYFMAANGDKNPHFVIICIDDEDLFPKYLESLGTFIHEFDAEASSRNKQALRILVKKGSLNEITADVIVNTTSSNLDLTKGAVSAALSNTAGSGMQNECRESYPQGVKAGDVVVTRGYYLRCNRVFHGTIPKYKAGKKSFEHIIKFMHNCLVKAVDYQATTIAFPAIGTGNLQYPVEAVATEMFNCVRDFQQSGHNTFLKDVLFVIYHNDNGAFKAFKKQETATPDIDPIKAPAILELVGLKPDIEKAKTELRKKCDSSEGFERQINRRPDETDTFACVVARNGNKTEENKKASIGSKAITETLSWSSDRRNAFVCSTKENLTVRVYQQDILELPVDCIINAANENLVHYGGIAKAIADAAGQDLEKESREYIDKHGILRVGDAVPTTAGALRYKCVIHAVGPCWEDYYPHDERDVQACKAGIKAAIYNSLEVAMQHQMKSVAFPAISSAIFKVPKEICATEYANAVLKFSKLRQGKPGQSIKEVHFVDKDGDMIDVIKDIFKTKIVDGIQDKANTNYGNTYKRGQSSDAAAAEHKPVDIQTKIKNPIGNIYPLFVETGNSLECKFSPNHVLKIITSDICSIKDVEAIVCSEDRYGTGLGKVAKTLKTLGKTKYTDDKYGAFKRNPGFGDVVITSGGRSRYTWILHAIVPDRYGEKGWKKTMQCVFDRIFEESSKRGFNSMATSLLGTGKFGGDPQRCAEVFLDSYTVACNRYHDKPLTLHMVNIDTNITQAVISVFKSHIKSRHDQGPVSAMPDVYDTQSYSSSFKRKPPRKPNTFGRSISDSSLSGTNSEAGLSDLKKKTTMVKKTEDADDNCVICMDTLDDPKTLKCGHTFCTDCIDQQFKFKQACPTCGTVCGIITGDQPDGKMEVVKSYSSLAGYQGFESIAITYTFKSGQQSSTHPRPGTLYKGITRTAYLPDNEEGRQICAMLRVAFDRKLVFTIGASRTTGQEGVITWNDIHHKTDQKPNTQFGYPDATYLARVTDELGAKGVTKSDIEKKFLRNLESSSVGQQIK